MTKRTVIIKDKAAVDKIMAMRTKVEIARFRHDSAKIEESANIFEVLAEQNTYATGTWNLQLKDNEAHIEIEDGPESKKAEGWKH